MKVQVHGTRLQRAHVELAGALALDRRAEPREPDRTRRLHLRDGAERERQRHAQRRGGGESRPLRQVAGDLEHAPGHLDAGAAQLRDGAWQEALVAGEARAQDLAVVQFGSHGDSAIDGEWQAEAIVVVGVLADQVHASRRESPDGMRIHGHHHTSSGTRPWTDWGVAELSDRTYLRVACSCAMEGGTVAKERDWRELDRRTSGGAGLPGGKAPEPWSARGGAAGGGPDE